METEKGKITPDVKDVLTDDGKAAIGYSDRAYASITFPGGIAPLSMT
jgi:hypothetical protein